MLHHIEAIQAWFLQNKRDLPWRKNRTPYHVWLSEIMLQQTQVAVVESYFLRFTERFPTLLDLANASEDDVLALWSGLGYYSRGRNLHKAAQKIISENQGIFPDTLEALQKLPGVGSYTAGAILAFAFNQPAAVVDGNVARVLARLTNDDTVVNSPRGKGHFESLSLALAKQSQTPAVLQEGIMELGARICKPKPACCDCPCQATCLAHAAGTEAGLPQKTATRSRTELHVACLILHNKSHVFLEKNPHHGLFGGLYMPPSVTVDGRKRPEKVIADVAKEHGIGLKQIAGIEPLFVKRVLTHRDLFLYGFPVWIEKPSQREGWMLKSQMDQIGLPTAMQTLLNKALK